MEESVDSGKTSLEEAFCNLFIVGKNARAYGF
jgi:hypothetical protein